MTDDFQLVESSGSVVYYWGLPDGDGEQSRANLAAELIRAMREQNLTAAAASKLTGATAADLSHVRKTNRRHISITRHVRVINGLKQHHRVSVVPMPLGPTIRVASHP